MENLVRRAIIMLVVDAHCDTLTKAMELNTNIQKNECHIDLHRLKQYEQYVQFFAAFIDPDLYKGCAMRRAIQVIDFFYGQLDIYSDDIMLCCNYNDILRAYENNKVAALLSIEGGEALEGSLGALRMFYKLGVRSLCLTWNYRNEIADGVIDGESGGGLTHFGKEVVAEMNKLGMLIDVSHLSERGFWDVCEFSSQPIIASHSNSKSVCSNIRNLTDSQISAIKEKGGVIGINFYPLFLNNTYKACITDIIRHIEHISAFAGCDYIGLGSDFDGIGYTPENIKGVQDTYLLFNELLKLNYSEEFLRKFAGENFMRVIKQVLK